MCCSITILNSILLDCCTTTLYIVCEKNTLKLVQAKHQQQGYFESLQWSNSITHVSLEVLAEFLTLSLIRYQDQG